MRLTKTLYIVTEENGQVIDYDPFGRPIYGDPETIKSPFKGEVEPYSNTLAERTYGVFVEVTNRVFCKPNEDLKILSDIEYLEESYKVTEIMKYDKHYEVLIRKGAN
ncbi:hypothetical protein [Halalkalibacter krulwichiae]|uniref:Phage protein n=1 Tax=Halalkalibacter krulwichiae TaxID=199441 RepID=A0A1X9MJK1_9BACI|nr:hypothetical protein [Halalkalibacter krulwichiae]ARK30772.1 hypothetical protein BkAM31D_13525 [Halalkalibacter krulwichiae]